LEEKKGAGIVGRLVLKTSFRSNIQWKRIREKGEILEQTEAASSYLWSKKTT